MTDPFTLTLAIPVWNDPDGVQRLVVQAIGTGCFDQIIVVDDGSDQDMPALPEQVLVLRQDVQQGAGAARNRALGAVTGSHVLFFDSDDLLTAEIAPLWHSLSDHVFDFCLFRHADSRMMQQGHHGQMRRDEALWKQAGALGCALAPAGTDALPVLAQTANYPWNKIYRTAFLHDHDIRCSHTPVHNDITLHWRSFFHADRVLTSDRICARHYVAADGGRLTNRGGTDRMVVFDVLTEVAHQLPEFPKFMTAFWRFSSNLFDWARSTLTPDHHSRFDAAMTAFLRQHLKPDHVRSLAHKDPVLARRLLAQMTAQGLAA